MVIGLDAPGDPPEDLERMVEHPERIMVATGDPLLLEMTIDIQDAERRQTIIRLERPPALPAERTRPMPAGRVQQADNLGQAIAWTGLVEGTPAYDPDGRRVGVVDWVDAPMGIFEGVVIHTRPLPGRHRFAGHHRIAELRECGVVLSVGADGNALVRALELRDSDETVVFANRVAEEAVDYARRPKLTVTLNRVRIAVANLHHLPPTRAEVRLARKADAVLAEHRRGP